MEPLPETDEALDEYLESDDTDLRAQLVEMARRVVSIVPSCVGMSLGVVADSLTFTWVATSEEAAAIDAALYADGVPHNRVMPGQGKDLSTEIHDLLDEGRWSAFATASAAEGVQASLSLPIIRDAQVVGGINLYAAAPRAFEGKHADLAKALDASAEAAVTNADLGFHTRQLARATPRLLAERREIEVAVGVLAALSGTDIDTARGRLEEASLRAGITTAQAASVFCRLRGGGAD